MIPRRDTILIIEDELVGAVAWAGRHSIPLEWRPDDLEIRAILMQADDEQQPFYLRGRFDDYRAVAPAWVFSDKTWQSQGLPHLFPKPPANPPFGASIFHTNAVICAPFNRLAYGEHSGPHSDWGGPTNWMDAGAQYVHAETLGDMLHVIYNHFRFTHGRLGAEPGTVDG